MNKLLFGLVLCFGLQSLGSSFYCSPNNYAAKFNDPRESVKKAYEAVFFGMMEKWFKQVHGQPDKIHTFKVEMVPGSVGKDYVQVNFQAVVETINRKKFSFTLTERIYVIKGNDPLNANIQTCGPNAGLPVTFLMDVYDHSGAKIDSILLDFFWGSKLCYQYKIPV